MFLNLQYSLKNAIFGAAIYTIGDSIASLLSNDFSFLRFFGIMLIGATIYAFEIPNYFLWISKKTEKYVGIKASIYRTALALLYFNPIWITRHLFFIQLLSLNLNQVSFNIFYTGLISFCVNIPISTVANYIIQNKIAIRYRFIASASFSGLMAIYYALSGHWFN